MATTQPLGPAPEESAEQEEAAQLIGLASHALRAEIEEETRVLNLESPQVSNWTYTRQKRKLDGANAP